MSQNLDEDVPVDIAEIAEESQYVVLASIEAVEPGARFYGHTDEDPREIWTEDVFLRLSIVDSFKGDLANLTSITWPAYFTSAPDSRSRSSRIEIEGVVLSEANPAMTYLFFLTDYGEPWGLTTTYKSAGLMQVNPAGRVTGQVSSIFEEYRGQALEEILQDADLR